jgi:hypothetical protein
MTASRARSSDIGKEREKSRIGTRRPESCETGTSLSRAIGSRSRKIFAMQHYTFSLKATI